MQQPAAHVADVVYEPERRGFSGEVTFASPRGWLRMRVSVVGPPTWPREQLCAALAEAARRRAAGLDGGP